MTSPPTPLTYATAETPADPGSPWRAIWVRPRLVVRWILATDPTRRVPELLAGGAIASSLVTATVWIGPGGNTGYLMLHLVLGTAVLFWMNYDLLPSALTALGRRLGGTGTYDRVQVAVAYASIPTIWALVPVAFSLPLLALQQFAAADAMQAGFNVTAAYAGGGAMEAGLILTATLAQVVIGVWGTVVFVACLAEAHRFSAWRAVMTLASFGVLVATAMLLVLVLVVRFLELKA